MTSSLSAPLPGLPASAPSPSRALGCSRQSPLLRTALPLAPNADSPPARPRSSLDHSMFFYDDAMDASDWLLFTMTSPALGQGRGLVSGTW